MTPDDGPLIDDRCAPRRPGDVKAAARKAHALGFRYLSWLYLLENEVRRAL